MEPQQQQQQQQQNVACNDCGIATDATDATLRVILISVQAGCIFVTLLLSALVFHFRKSKGIAGSAWILLELILFGSLLLYSIVILRYFEPTPERCLLEPWLRELGFTFTYGTIVLKIYRLLVEFRTRKAHRWVVREKDLLKYWTVMVACVIVYLSSGTVSTLQHNDYTFWSNTSIPSENGLKSGPGLGSGRPGRSGAAGIRVRGDGGRTWYSNASFLQQKARVLRRESDLSDSMVSETADNVTLAPALLNSSSDISAAYANLSNKCSEMHQETGLPGAGLVLTKFNEDTNATVHTCRELWWHYVNTVGEMLFLLSGLYISYSARNAARHQGEKICLFAAIFLEFVISCAYALVAKAPWIFHHPDYIFLLEFVRSHLATTLVLAIIFGPKLVTALRQSSNQRHGASLHYQNSQSQQQQQQDSEIVQIPMDSEIFKVRESNTATNTTTPANGDIDLANLDLSQMDPELIREELKRVYTQLYVLKMKTLRKDNPHISKRRGGRKTSHRKFSLQRSKLTREKSKINRSLRHKEVAEEGAEESICSLEATTTATSVPVVAATSCSETVLTIAEVTNPPPAATKLQNTRF